jgi:hypothetical protein
MDEPKAQCTNVEVIEDLCRTLTGTVNNDESLQQSISLNDRVFRPDAVPSSVFNSIPHDIHSFVDPWETLFNLNPSEDSSLIGNKSQG